MSQTFYSCVSTRGTNFGHGVSGTGSAVVSSLAFLRSGHLAASGQFEMGLYRPARQKDRPSATRLASLVALQRRLRKTVLIKGDDSRAIDER